MIKLKKDENQVLMVNMRPEGFMNPEINEKIEVTNFLDWNKKKPFKLLFKYKFDLSPEFSNRK